MNAETTAAHIFAINYDGSVNSSATVNINGGTLTVGSPSFEAVASAIAFFDATSENSSASAAMSITSGTVNAYGGIEFGVVSGVIPGTATLTQSGGSLNVGPNGIFFGAGSPNTTISLSGGTVGALASTGWSSSLPMTLGAAEGNTTFNCAYSGGTANISLSGPLTDGGLGGGLYVTGGGTLTLSGTNTYSGATVVSNGTLAIATTATTTSSIGTLGLDGSAGSPDLTVSVSSPGQTFTNTGLNFTNGSTAFTVAFSALAPSTTVAPMQVSGNVGFGSTPTVTITGSAIAVGTYPLIKYTGTVSGTVPSSVSTPGYISSAYITNLTGSKTIALVVTGSTYNPALYWAIGSGAWNTNSLNWKQFSLTTNYQDGDAVIFDDSASGPSPITVTLNTTVNPLAVTFNNSADQYNVTGTGSIAGSTAVTLLNNGQVALGGVNTYSGGTTVGATSQLNINNGGSASGSAVGTGTLTLNAGATIDNTSGADVTLQYPVPITWNGNFTYVGSANNFNTGSGAVTMMANTKITVGANNLTVGGSISDNGGGFLLTKSGNGTLTLTNGNFISGGFTLSSGLVNISNASALGGGVTTISGGAIDNISGQNPLYLATVNSYEWGGSFSFLGSASLALASSANISIPNGLGSITVDIVSNTLTTDGAILNNNTTVIKTGNGTWDMTGSANGQSLGLEISAGEVTFGMTGGQAITGGNNVGLTVQPGALAQDQQNQQIHSDSAVALPVNLFGGTWDLNGYNENVDKLSLTSGGTLQDSGSSSSTINLISGYTASLTGTNCQFEVDQAGGILNFKGPIRRHGLALQDRGRNSQSFEQQYLHRQHRHQQWDRRPGRLQLDFKYGRHRTSVHQFRAGLEPGDRYEPRFHPSPDVDQWPAFGRIWRCDRDGRFAGQLDHRARIQLGRRSIDNRRLQHARRLHQHEARQGQSHQRPDLRQWKPDLRRNACIDKPDRLARER